jgi:hypothetical protein
MIEVTSGLFQASTENLHENCCNSSDFLYILQEIVGKLSAEGAKPARIIAERNGVHPIFARSY